MSYKEKIEQIDTNLLKGLNLKTLLLLDESATEPKMSNTEPRTVTLIDHKL